MNFRKGQTIYYPDKNTFTILELTYQRTFTMNHGAPKIDAGTETLYDAYECCESRESAERELIRRARFDIDYHRKGLEKALSYLASLPEETGEAAVRADDGIPI